MFCQAVENLLGHIHSLLHEDLLGIIFSKSYSEAENELLAKTSKKWTEGREIPWDGSPWLESLTLLSSQPAAFLFCISGPCLLLHATKNKQTNLSLRIFRSFAKLQCC